MRLKSWVAAVVLVGVAAGCGSGSSTAKGRKVATKQLTPVELVAESADATNAAKTARIDATMTVSGDAMRALGQDGITISMRGRTALDGSKSELTMDMGAILPGASGVKIKALMIGGVTYMDFKTMLDAIAKSTGDKVPGDLLGTKKWIKTEGAGSVSGSGSSASSFTQYLEYLRGASEDGITTVGTETIDGTKTTHYKADLNVAKVKSEANKRIGAMGASEQRLLDKGLQALAGLKYLPVEVWIDADGLLHRMKFSFSMNPAGSTVSMVMLMNLSDFGVDTSDITAPPASEVTDMADLRSALT